ncbi:MAG: TatD family hydrolase [Candidatus Jorgensenbacteria bacterium]
MIRYFDAHTHVQFKAFDNDYREVIGRAAELGVGMVLVGTQKDTSRRAVELTREYPDLYAAVALHPIHTSKSYHDSQELGEEGLAPLEAGQPLTGFTSRGETFDYEYYKKLALDSKIVAIGECGLDYFRLGANREEQIAKQKEAFLKQIELAYDVKKPLMTHCRSAFPDLIEILIHNSKFLTPGNPGIVHFFSGTVGDAKKLLEMGFYFTFGGVITFVRDYDEVIKIIPVERMLSETDAPYVAPVPYRGKRNEPAHVIEVVKKLAEIKNISEEEMRVQILKNVERVFGIKIR